MTIRLDAEWPWPREDRFVAFSNVTRVATSDGYFKAVMIHDGGKLSLRHPEGHIVTIFDEGDLNQATIEQDGKPVEAINEAHGTTRINGVGTVLYKNPGRLW